MICQASHNPQMQGKSHTKSHTLAMGFYSNLSMYSNVVGRVQAVDISSCGNYAIIGYSSGHVDVYNLQSGKHRGSFGKPVGKWETAVIEKLTLCARPTGKFMELHLNSSFVAAVVHHLFVGVLLWGTSAFIIIFFPILFKHDTHSGVSIDSAVRFPPPPAVQSEPFDSSLRCGIGQNIALPAPS